ncbi:MAG: HYR domain-containing protein, partial [Rhodobacteraceae bacterium]|nr:HYR domain-containing protein [Paracoccaceae bacterium]
MTVTDNQPPVAICQDITLQLDVTGNVTITGTDIDGGSTDNGSIVSYTASQTAFDCTHLGANTVTLTVTDDGGNSSTCDATVTVEDNITPTALCQDITIQLDGTGSATITGSDIDGGSTDNCTVSSLTASQTTFDCTNLGANTVTLTVADQSGNTSTCTSTVTVEDTELPQIICPSDIHVSTDLGLCEAVVTYATPVGTDNCASPVTTMTSGLVTGSTFPVGVTTVSYEVVDTSGNTSSCSFTVTVTDAEEPTISCPSDITVDFDGACQFTLPDYTGGATASDNCSLVGDIALTQSPLAGTVITADQVVTLTATDESGNSTDCSFTITTEDTTLPQISCPSDITTTTDLGLCGAVVTYTTPVGTDNCSGVSTSMTSGLASGDTFPVGSTTVTYEVTDTSGNTSSCSFTVTVTDEESPVAVCQDITVNLDGTGTVTITPSDVDGGSTDNCGVTPTGLSQT